MVSAVAGQVSLPPRTFSPHDVTVMRSWISSSTLRLRFEAHPLPLDIATTGRSATYVLAGSPMRLPRARFVAGHLYRIRGDQVVGETYDSPPGADPATAFLRINDMGLFRQFHVYSLTLSLSQPAQPLIANAAEIWVVDYMEFEIDLGPPVTTDEHAIAEARARFAPDAGRLLPAALMLDADIAPAWYVTTSTATWNAVREWAHRIEQPAAAASLFKTFFYEPGLYCISRSDLEKVRAAAMDTSLTTPLAPVRQWRVYHGGQEVAPLDLDELPGDALALLVPQWDVDEHGPAVFWIDASGTAAETTPPLRLQVTAPVEAPHDTAAATVQYELTAEKFEDYQTRIQPTQDVTKWFWKTVPPEGIETFPITFPDDFSPTGPVELVVHSALSHQRQTLPQIEIISDAETAAIAPLLRVQGSTVCHIPAKLLHAGTNEIGVRLHYTDDSPEEKRELLVQKFVLRWYQKPTRAGGTVFRVPAPPAQPPAPLLFEGDARSDSLIACVDSTSPWVGRVRAGQPARFDDVPRARPLIATALQDLRGPASIELASTTPLALLAPRRGSDYLAIVPRSLAAALEPLLARRAAQGFNVCTACAEDIFDLFGYGEHASQPLRDFLRYAFYEWPAPALSHVILVGEASDYRRDPRQAPPSCQIDMIPTCGSVRVESVHGDHPYACVAGQDAVPDLFLGRLSVATVEELTTAIAKLLRYEDQPAGEWASRALYVLDDNEEFPRVASEIVRCAAAPPLFVRMFRESDYPYVPNERVYGKRRSREATAALLRQLDSGLGFVNYFGHGGPNLWSHERLLHIMDLASLHEPSRLPLIACASCDNAWFDYPMPPVRTSMGELFVKQPQGGAVAVFAPVSGATPYEHQNLMMYLLEGITRTPLRTSGELGLYAKISYYAQTLSPSVPEQYVLVGDPAVELKIPRITGTLHVEPAVIEPDSLASIDVLATGLPEDCSTATLHIISIAPNDEVLSRPVALMRGRTSAVVSLDGVPTGAYGVVLECTDSAGVAHFFTGRFDALPRHIAFDEGALAQLAKRVVGSTETVRTSLALFNPTPIDGVEAALHAALVDSDSGHPLNILDKVLTLSAGQACQHTFGWKPSYPLRLLASWKLTSRNAAGKKLDFELPRRDDATSDSFSVPFGAQISSPVQPTQFDQPTFACDVWNTGIDMTRDAMVTLYQGDEPLVQSQLLTQLSPGAKRQMLFASKRSLPAGDTTVTVLIHRHDPTTTATDAWETVYERTNAVHICRAPDLEIVPGSVVAELPSEGLIARTSVIIHALLRNKGEVDARGVRMQLMIDDPTTGTEAVMLNEERAATISEVPAGATIPIVARWENCTVAGWPVLWLVVNGAHTIKEPDYTNNVARVPSFKVRQLGDFRAVALDLSAEQAAAGTTVTLLAAVSSDADIARGPLDVELGWRNPLTGKSQRERHIIGQIPPCTTMTLGVAMAFDPDYTEGYAIVNPSKELEESDAGGDEASRRITPVLPLTARAAATSATDLTGDLARTISYNTELLPGPALRLQDHFTSSSGLMPVDSSWAMGKDFITAPRGDADTGDGKWVVAPWLIEACASEYCPPLSLRVPIAPWIPGASYDLYVHATGSNNYRGGPVHRFGVAIGEGKFATIEVKAQASPGATQRCHVGSFRAHDPNVNLSIWQLPGSGVVIRGVEIVPAVGTVESPIYQYQPRPGTSMTLKFTDNDASGSAIHYWIRCGDTGPTGAIVWGEWTDVSGKQSVLPGTQHFFQWRAELRLADGPPRPTIKRVEIAEGE
jgi:hypothetical protein